MGFPGQDEKRGMSESHPFLFLPAALLKHDIVVHQLDFDDNKRMCSVLRDQLILARTQQSILYVDCVGAKEKLLDRDAVTARHLCAESLADIVGIFTFVGQTKRVALLFVDEGKELFRHIRFLNNRKIQILHFCNFAAFFAAAHGNQQTENAAKA